jgi:hypothetical protein
LVDHDQRVYLDSEGFDEVVETTEQALAGAVEPVEQEVGAVE